MHVSGFASMCLFTTELSHSQENPNSVIVRFGLEHTFDQPDKKLPEGEEVIEVPLRPNVQELKYIEYDLHGTITRAYVMPQRICKWFSDRFGFEVRLNFTGLHRRKPLGNINPNAPRTYAGDPNPEASYQMSPTGGWFDGIKSGFADLVGTLATYTGMDAYKGVDGGISFADCAPFMVINYRSFLDVQGRVHEDVDIEKFRPNIVVEGLDSAWVEDYWAEIGIGAEENGNRIAFTSNCVRCASLNVDYLTGKPGIGPKGQVLKSLQRDRRVDPGAKYSPVFGRYGFLSQKYGAQPTKPITISVGDEVTVTKLNDKRTHFCKLISLSY